MAGAEKLSAKVSTEEQINRPTGLPLAMEEADGDMLLKPAPAFAETRPEDVFGMLSSKGKPKTVAEMDDGVCAEAKRRHARV